MALNNLEKETISHICKLADSYNDYPIYEAVYDSLNKIESMTSDQRKDILSTLSTAMSKVKEPVFDIRRWAKSMQETNT